MPHMWAILSMRSMSMSQMLMMRELGRSMRQASATMAAGLE